MNEKLFSILKNNAQSDCGKRWNFANIRTVEGYRNTVPMTCYDDYAPLIELTTRIGETGIYAGQPLIGYAQTSGTTGVPKRIPCTQSHLNDYLAAFEKLSVEGSTLLLFESMPHTFKYADQVPLDSITGLVLGGEQKKLRDDSHKRLFRSGTVTSPMELLVTKEVMDSTHLRLLFALIDDNVEQIIAPFTWGVLEMFSYLEGNWRDIVENIRTGRISGHVHVAEKVRLELEKKLKRNPKRADALEAIFAQGFAEPVAPRIWPKFRRVVAAGSGSFAIYTEKLKRYIGKAAHINGFYACSEALIGECLEPGSDVYTLISSNAFLEFLPVSGDPKQPLLPEELKEGEDYEIILTNDAGFYRYRLGEVIRWLGNGHFTLRYRKAQLIRLGAVCLDEQQILQAVCGLEADCALEIDDYCVWVDEEENRLTLLLEPENRRSSIARLYSITPEALSAKCDALLAQASPAYAEARRAGTLGTAVALVLEPQTQLLYRDVRKYRVKMAPDQMKPVRVLENPVQEKFFFFALDKEYHSSETLNQYIGSLRR